MISKNVAHPPLIDSTVFEEVQQILHGRGRGPGQEHKTHRSRHLYVLKGLVYCGLCQRRMQGQRNNGEAYYRCRYAQEYALANNIDHPPNVHLRERDIVAPLDNALASAFTPHRIEDTISWLNDSQSPPAADDDHTTRQASARLADCDKKLASYRAALDAGADPTVVTTWISETQNERRTAQQTASRATTRTPTTPDP